MRRALISALAIVLATTAATRDAFAEKKIQKVLKADIAGCDKAPPNIRSDFLAHVKRSCEGKTQCSVGPTQLYASADLSTWQCKKGFSVRISCGGSDIQEYPTDVMTQKIDVFCDAP
ncbi:hypothetical protein [Bradyrhizobium arachidis]|uniref:hypothetical protein n=1 Tax=Bradyrhizobium arachidis TaxID=858423 RepID=UPI002162B6DF|nr:hypothetical protein [Bradyrhizobium arachidis]UVO31123.1 hypothetical protein KUF59_10970 [Bradyrhizobium arachidis]